jgi:hypothetical protein
MTYDASHTNQSLATVASPTAHLHRSQEARMERRSCNDRLKPPPVRGSVSVAVDSSLPHGPTRDVRRPGSAQAQYLGIARLPRGVKSRRLRHNQGDCSRHAFEPAETASLSWWARLRATSLGDSSSWLIHFMAAWPSAVADSAAPINHKKKPTHSNTTPELIKLRLTSSGGREVEWLTMVLPF